MEKVDDASKQPKAVQRAAQIKAVVLSDTHGQLSQLVENAISAQSPDLIVHAGDIACAQILWRLEMIAPTFAVKGNCDFDPEIIKLPAIARKSIGNSVLVLTHRPEDLYRDLDRDLDRSLYSSPDCCLEKTLGNPALKASSNDAIDRALGAKNKYIIGIHGHTHIPELTTKMLSGTPVQIVCPGSVTQPRGDSVPTIAAITAQERGAVAPTIEFIEV